MSKPHKHAALIHAWADGATIEVRPPSGPWFLTIAPQWCEDAEYRVKPERVWPVTTMTYDELMRVYGEHPYTSNVFFAIANAAIRRYIIDTESTKEQA